MNEAIISSEEFEKASKVLRVHKKHSYHGERNYVLKGKIYCGNCNRKLTYECNTYKEVFYCKSGRQIGKYSKCHKDDYEMKYIENVVMQSLKEWIVNLQLLGANAAVHAKEQMSKSKIQQKDIKLELDKLNAEKIRLYERYAGQMLTKELYLEKKKQIVKKINSLEELGTKRGI